MCNLDINVTDEGVRIKVHARAGARKNAITGIHDGGLCISVTQAPERGKANAAIIALLAGQLGTAKRNVQLISGETNSNKQFLLVAITEEEALQLVSIERAP